MNDVLLTRAEIVRAAADWLAVQNPKPSPIVPTLRDRFDLSPVEAIEAIRESALQNGRAT